MAEETQRILTSMEKDREAAWACSCKPSVGGFWLGFLTGILVAALASIPAYVMAGTPLC